MEPDARRLIRRYKDRESARRLRVILNYDYGVSAYPPQLTDKEAKSLLRDIITSTVIRYIAVGTIVATVSLMISYGIR